jgi:hypothetical protein
MIKPATKLTGKACKEGTPGGAQRAEKNGGRVPAFQLRKAARRESGGEPMFHLYASFVFA